MLKSEGPNRLERLDHNIFYNILSFTGIIPPVSKSLENQQNFLVLTKIQHMGLFSAYLNINPKTSSLRDVNQYLKGLLPEQQYICASHLGINDINRYSALSEEIQLYENCKLTKLAKELVLQIPNIPKDDAQKIRDFLNSPANSQELGKITRLNLRTSSLVNIPNEIRFLVNLSSIDLSDNKISDLTPLAGLTKLERLNLSYNQISDLKPLKGLTLLSVLYMDENKISDLTPILKLKLDSLTIKYNFLYPVSEELRNKLEKIRGFYPYDLAFQTSLPQETLPECGGGGGSKEPGI